MNKKENKKIKMIGIIMLVVCVFGITVFIKYQKDIKEYSPEKLEAFLEERLEQDISVEPDIWAYVHDGVIDGYMPYIAEVVLDDGETITFAVQWKSGYDVDDGVYTEYGKELVIYYAEKYRIEYETLNPFNINVNSSELSGIEPVFTQFLVELWDSQYIRCGQEIKLYIKSEVGYSTYLDLKIDEPINYDELYEKLTAFKDK